uniref:Uncharacterized protein n=1 Tax=Chromera velia CCMP2878 TaxID=1169474 RepID=A0A0G4H9C8_9ALVE|eukprot:Cvel_5906.t2-p1 / transcript=Cvel_5906.t2 / gene=Cvel_5906 / organism=Chromera_velia_CCMP2878 / gene_product=hypothetical protein / transcript_product=hypothetical protein / location=Cvel_scaffold282:3620-5868(-) / protein_length=591 / sequence_SO=supercontig / SO=protein_coding / is_pseudo=false
MKFLAALGLAITAEAIRRDNPWGVKLRKVEPNAPKPATPLNERGKVDWAAMKKKTGTTTKFLIGNVWCCNMIKEGEEDEKIPSKHRKARYVVNGIRYTWVEFGNCRQVPKKKGDTDMDALWAMRQEELDDSKAEIYEERCIAMKENIDGRAFSHHQKPPFLDLKTDEVTRMLGAGQVGEGIADGLKDMKVVDADAFDKQGLVDKTDIVSAISSIRSGTGIHGPPTASDEGEMIDPLAQEDVPAPEKFYCAKITVTKQDNASKAKWFSVTTDPSDTVDKGSVCGGADTTGQEIVLTVPADIGEVFGDEEVVRKIIAHKDLPDGIATQQEGLLTAYITNFEKTNVKTEEQLDQAEREAVEVVKKAAAEEAEDLDDEDAKAYSEGKPVTIISPLINIPRTGKALPCNFQKEAFPLSKVMIENKRVKKKYTTSIVFANEKTVALETSAGGDGLAMLCCYQFWDRLGNRPCEHNGQYYDCDMPNLNDNVIMDCLVGAGKPFSNAGSCMAEKAKGTYPSVQIKMGWKAENFKPANVGSIYKPYASVCKGSLIRQATPLSTADGMAVDHKADTYIYYDHEKGRHELQGYVIDGDVVLK